MKALGLGDLDRFPVVEPPTDDPYATYALLQDWRNSTPRALTDAGRQLAQLPSTRHRPMIADEVDARRRAACFCRRVLLIGRPLAGSGSTAPPRYDTRGRNPALARRSSGRWRVDGQLGQLPSGTS